MMKEVKCVLDRLKDKVVVSVQAMPNEPLYEEVCMQAMIKSVLKGNPGGLRLAGARDVKNARTLTELPIIGLTKPEVIPPNFKELVYITPSVTDVNVLLQAGCDVVAFDATGRKRPTRDTLVDLIKYTAMKKKVSMGDIATFDEAVRARELGINMVSTTLSGYTVESDGKGDEPDFELLERLVKTLDCPVVLEGRIWTVEQTKLAFELGAHCVVIGSAVTRPQLIVKRFVSKGVL